MAMIKLKKGYDLKLKGGIANDTIFDAPVPTHCAIVPDDFTGIIPRMEKKEGEQVKAGEALYHDKTEERIKVTSPVSGTVKAIVRGERRKIEQIVVECDNNDDHKKFDPSSPIDALLDSGLWAMLRQRPYDVVPSPGTSPRDIFVTCFDSAPLAPNLNLVLGEDAAYVEKGVEVLSKLTTGSVYLGCKAGETLQECLKRELIEEMDLKVEVGPLFMQSVYDYAFGSFVINAFFAYTQSFDIPKICEHEQLLWVSPKDLFKYEFAPADIPIIEAYVKSLNA